MRKLLLILVLTLIFLLSGCVDNTVGDGATCLQKEECDYKYVFRVKVLEEIEDNVYMVEKHEYTTQAYFQVYTEQELEIGDIVQLAVYDNDTTKMFNELICVENQEGE